MHQLHEGSATPSSNYQTGTIRGTTTVRFRIHFPIKLRSYYFAYQDSQVSDPFQLNLKGKCGVWFHSTQSVHTARFVQDLTTRPLISVSQRTNEAKIMKVFAEDTVKDNLLFFIAGRGGETNLHKGNYDVRQRVLDNAMVYAGLTSRERGSKFSQKLLREDLEDFTFVVSLSYFWRNFENGKIASAKLESVVNEHGSLSALEGLPMSSYVTIGENWCLHIVGAILRQAAGKLDLADPKPLTPKAPRKRCSQRKATGKSNRQPKQEDEGTHNQSKTLGSGANTHEQHSEPNSPESSYFAPDDASLYQTTKRTRVSFESITLLNATPPQALQHKARRVSLCPSADHSSHTSAEPVSFGDFNTFYPVCDEDKSKRALRVPRQVSSESIPWATLNEIVPFGEHQDHLDPFDSVLAEWDIEKWPQLDLHDLMAV